MYLDFLRSNFTSLLREFRKLMPGSRSTAGASETRSIYNSATRASQTSSQPPSPRASPSNVSDIDEMTDDGDAASASVGSTAAHRCRSFASAPAQPSRSMAPTSAQPSYCRSAYTGSSKGKGDNSPSIGGKGASSYLEGVCPLGTLAVIAASGRVIVSGGTTGLGILERALANMPVLVSTLQAGPPTDIDAKLCNLRGCPPLDNAEYLRQQCQDVWESHRQSDSSEEWFDSRTGWFNPQKEEDFACYTGHD